MNGGFKLTTSVMIGTDCKGIIELSKVNEKLPDPKWDYVRSWRVAKEKKIQ